MGSNEGWGGPLGKLEVNWEVCEAMSSREPKAHMGHHNFNNASFCFSQWISWTVVTLD